MQIKNTNDFVKSQESLSQLGAIHIGNQVGGWRLGNDICLDHGTYLSIAHELGIPERYLVDPKSEISAFRSAVAQAKLPKGLKITQLKDISTDDRLVFALYKQTTKGGDTGDLRQTAIAAEHKMNLAFEPDNTSNPVELVAPAAGLDPELVEACNTYYTDLMALYRQNSKVVKSDIGSTLAKFCSHVGVTTQPRGGSYFIPKQYDATVNALSQLIDRVSKESNFIAIPCYASLSGNAAIKKEVIHGLNQEIESIDIDAFKLIAPPARLMLISSLVNTAIAAKTPAEQLPILKKISTNVSACRSLGMKVDAIAADVERGLVTYSEVVERLTKLKEILEPKQRTSNTAIANQIKDIKDLAAKVESFQVFLESESNRFQQYLKELGVVLEFKLTNDIFSSAERAGVKLPTNDKPQEPTSVTTEIDAPDTLDARSEEEVGF